MSCWYNRSLCLLSLLYPTCFMISFASICEWLDLTTLQYHWQVIAISALLCSILFEVSQSLSPLLFPKAFQHFKGVSYIRPFIHYTSTHYVLKQPVYTNKLAHSRRVNTACCYYHDRLSRHLDRRQSCTRPGVWI